MTMRSLGGGRWTIAPIALLLTTTVEAGEPIEAPLPRDQEISAQPATICAALERTIPLIERSSAEYLRQRECFSCHHQAMAILTLVEARDRGFEIDQENFAAQIQRTVVHLERGKSGYRQGRGQGGQADTAAWALWALELGGHESDDTTEAVANYLVGWQESVGHWQPPGRGRPPTQGSDFTTTYAVLRALSVYGTASQQDQIEARRDRVREWLAKTTPLDTEDRVYQLRILSYVATGDEEDGKTLESAAAELLREQQGDGGWSQLPGGDSDAYATATALVALIESGVLDAADDRYQRGLLYLLRTQLADGSWHVATRAKPVQTYFESGFPHERDQFLSMAATCWAATALLKALPTSP